MQTPINRHSGASLLEALGFAAIAAIVVVGAASLLTGGFTGLRSNSLHAEIQALRTAVVRIRGVDGQFGPGSLTAAIATAGGLPSSLRRDASAGTITNQWGGSVTVTGTGPQFTLGYSGVPRSECAQGLAVIAPEGWLAVTINGTSLPAPASPDSAAGACNALTNSFVLTGS